MSLFESDRPQLNRIERMLGALLRSQGIVIHMELHDMAIIDDIRAKQSMLAETINKDDDLISSLTGALEAKDATISDLNRQLKDAIANGADPAQLQAISDTMDQIEAEADAQNRTLAAAVQNNTAPQTSPATPVITDISPSFADAAGGSQVTITGRGFTGVQSVKFGDANSTSIVPDHDTRITATVPPGTDGGDVPVIVSGALGATAPFSFHYGIPQQQSAPQGDDSSGTVGDGAPTGNADGSQPSPNTPPDAPEVPDNIHGQPDGEPTGDPSVAQPAGPAPDEQSPMI